MRRIYSITLSLSLMILTVCNDHTTSPVLPDMVEEELTSDIVNHEGTVEESGTWFEVTTGEEVFEVFDVADAVAADDMASEEESMDTFEVEEVEPPVAICLSAEECNIGDPASVCFDWNCEPSTGCVYAPLLQQGCYTEPILLATDFEKDISGFEVVDLANSHPVVWAISDQRAHSGTHSIRFGDPMTNTFGNNKKVAAVIRSPVVTPIALSSVRLLFFVWADVEDGDLWDVLTVSVETENFAVPVWSKGYGFTMRKWFPVAIDLSAFAGMSIRIAITFNSVDDSFNDGEGVYIDDLYLLYMASPISCSSAAECDDHIPCTEESCDQGSCAYTLSEHCCTSDVECDDFDACTHDLCRDGGCEHVPSANPLCCNTDADCDDKNACTDDSCIKNLCKHTIASIVGCCKADSECNDDDKCTKDLCQDFHCVHIMVCCLSDSDCDDHDDVCTQDFCINGKCVFKPTGKPGCCNPTIASFDFDSGSDESWSFTPLTEGVGWHIVTNGDSVSMPGSLYYGNPDTWNYAGGYYYNDGVATSDQIELPAALPISLSFMLSMQTDPYSWDDLYVYVTSEGLPEVTVYNTWKSFKSFEKVTLDISAWAGRTIRLKFEFIAWDGGAYGGKGAFIDDIAITTSCEPKTCQEDKECDDLIYESLDKCQDGICVYSFKV